MKAQITSFRGAYKNQKASNQVIVRAADSKEAAEKLVDKKILWLSPKGKEIAGKVSAVHGGKGAVRAIFEKGLPGQAIGTDAEIQ